MAHITNMYKKKIVSKIVRVGIKCVEKKTFNKKRFVHLIFK